MNQEHSPFNQFKDLDAWVKFFEKNDKLPQNKILCSVCKDNPTSMLRFSNLKNTLPKFQNNIRKLLTEFKCRECRSIGKPVKAAKVRNKVVDNSEVEPRAKKGSKMVETPEEREARIEAIRADLPKIDFNKPKMDYDLNNPTHVEVLTNDACWYPHIFLDGGRYCDACPIYINCCCKIKRLKK